MFRSCSSKIIPAIRHKCLVQSFEKTLTSPVPVASACLPLRIQNTGTHLHFHSCMLMASDYKSQHSLENIYPNSHNTNFLNTDQHLSRLQSTINNENNEFSGYIPIDELAITYSKSSGPGGQNVNKVSTKVEIRFHVASADWLPEWVRKNLLLKERNRISKDGYMIVSSDRTRKQLLNQADCIDKIRRIIYSSCEKPYEPSEEEIATKNKRIAKAQRQTLSKKREHSLKKQGRRGPSISDV